MGKKKNSDPEAGAKYSQRRRSIFGIRFEPNREKLKVSMLEYVAMSSVHGLRTFSEKNRSLSER